MARECIPGCDPSDCQCSAPPAGGGFRRARGILAGARGDALPEVRIRRLRDAWDWPEIDEQTRAQQAAMRNPEAQRG